MSLQTSLDAAGGVHVFLVEHNGQLGVDSGRNKFFVACVSCRKVLHWSTTSPQTWIDRYHLLGKPAPYEDP